MINFQDSFKNLFDVEAMQANFSKAYDFNAIQENLQKFYDVEAIQENVKNFYNLEQAQENLGKFFDPEAVKAYAESLADQELVQKNAKLAANLVAANVNTLSDAAILQTVQIREGVEGALKQADALATVKDPVAVFEAQKSYLEAQQEVAVENFWSKTGLVADMVEKNLELVKEAMEQVKPVAQKAKPAKKAA